MTDEFIPNWLPYGVSDDSIMIQHPLTSEFTAGDMNCTGLTYYGTGVNDGGVGLGRPTFDPVKGMMPKNASGYIGCRLTGLVDSTRLANGGQLTIEVSKDWVCAPESDSSGQSLTQEALMLVSQGGNEQLIGRANSIISAMLGLGYCNVNYWDNAATPATLRVHSADKGEYIRLNVGWGPGWIGGFVIQAIDDLFTYRSDGRNNGSYSNKWNSIWLGCGANAGFMTSNFTGDVWIRNFQVSTKVPVFPVHPVLGKCVLFGDSLVGTMLTNAPQMDCNLSFSVIRPLQQRGLNPGFFVAQSYGGYQVAQNGATELYGELSGLLAENPTTVFLRAGSNDSDNDSDTAAFLADLKDMIEVILGLNGNPSTSVQKLVIGNVPSRRYTLVNPTYDASGDPARVASVNADIASIPAWIASTYPARQNDVAVADCYAALGGEMPPDVTFLGQLGDGLDYPSDIHTAAGGNAKMGVEYVRALLTIIGK